MIYHRAPRNMDKVLARSDIDNGSHYTSTISYDQSISDQAEERRRRNRIYQQRYRKSHIISNSSCIGTCESHLRLQGLSLSSEKGRRQRVKEAQREVSETDVLEPPRDLPRSDAETTQLPSLQRSLSRNMTDGLEQRKHIEAESSYEAICGQFSMLPIDDTYPIHFLSPTGDNPPAQFSSLSTV